MAGKSVSTIVFSDDRKQILFQLREDFRLWTLPGGRIEAGETPEQAAIRETLEETGYDIEIDGYVGEYFRPDMPGDRTKFVFVGHIAGGTPVENGPETIRVAWFAPNALPSRLALPQFLREILEDALSPERHPVKRVQRISWLQARIIGLRLWLRDMRNMVTGHP